MYKYLAVLLATGIPAGLALAQGGPPGGRQTTVETDLVQIVVFGDVDLNRKNMDLNIQPRRIGKPLSRSPWPATVTGSFKDPKVRVKSGPKKLRRKDGASRMPARRKPCVPDILQLR